MILVTGFSSMLPATLHALPSDHYATKSVLAEGKWAKIKVTATGMHLITDAELRKLGFNDPSKVRIYGLGGRQTTPGFTLQTPDDLPQQPCVRTSKGIVFFGTDHISWEDNTGLLPYSHDIHAYSHDNYYFISDRDIPSLQQPSAATTAGGGDNLVKSFTARLLHEEELEFGGQSGCQIFGEDFRTKRSQNFDFKRIDAVDDVNVVKVRFGAKTTNGRSTLKFKANGQALPASNSDTFGSSDKNSYYSISETSKEITCGDATLSLNINYEQTGTLFFARLDYIEMFYNRKLALHDGEIYFYGRFSPGETLSVAGCSSSTQIWDVTDPSTPAKVEFTLQSSDGRFEVVTPGYREFIAFDPEQISRAATADVQISNQDIHGMETPDMVIITLPEYRQGAERIARLHESHDGFRVHVINAEEIYNEFSGGKCDFGAFRNMLKMWYDRGTDDEGHSLRYCLLMGRPHYDNKGVSAASKKLGYTPMPIYESYSGTDEHSSFCTDDYIAKLSDTTDSSFSLASAPNSIAVGRLPVKSASEASQMAEKIEKYVLNPDYGPWRNKVMLIADDEDYNAHLNQTQTSYKEMRRNGSGNRHVYDRIYLDSYQRVMTGLGATYPQATERMLRNYNDGVVFTQYIGHGSEVNWCHEHLWTWDDINSMTNKRLTFIYSATCRFGPWDEDNISAAEIVMMNPESGTIGQITTTRTVYVDHNGKLSESIGRELFKTNPDGSPRRFGDVYRDGKNGKLSDNTLRYIFMGDPAITIPGGSSHVTVETINGTDVVNIDNEEPVLPELTARSAATVSGIISKQDGTVDTEFNGNITIDLYDAERVITTYGQGSKGQSISYNDRDKRLSSVTLKVKDGQWSGTLRVPPEIQGNYTPAMIACYAWSDNGQEAQGTTENLYVYGFNNDAELDEEAPVIEQFYVNSPNFTNGGLVNSSPVIFARISDESGINISDSGIGHSMTLTIDDSKVLSDLNSYYTQDPDNPATGSLIYPVGDIKAGKHTLTLTVWDNANNVSKASLDINVGAAVDPVIYDMTASVTDTYIDFNINLDRPNTSLDVEIGVFDLNGRRLWSVEQNMNSGIESTVSARWDMTDTSGTRVPRGIYIYRAKVLTPEGTYATKSKKIAIAAPR